jgi:hypothetical protein
VGKDVPSRQPACAETSVASDSETSAKPMVKKLRIIFLSQTTYALKASQQ